MKLLIITGDARIWGISPFDYLLQELTNLVDELIVWKEPGHIGEILSRLKFSPDFILINEFGEAYTPHITGLKQLSIPWGVYLNDLSFNINNRKQALIELGVRYIFSRYRDKFYEWYPQLYKRLLWLPPHANTHIFKDYGSSRDIDYLFVGWADPFRHPLRQKIINELQGQPGFVCQPYLNCSDVWMEERHSLSRASAYAQMINRAQIFLTCDTVCRFPGFEYYQVLACNTLLMAPWSREIDDLGFIDGVHYVAINQYENIAEKAKYYLQNKQKRVQIALQGYQLVHSKHTTTLRAQQLVNMIASLLSS